MTGVISDTHGLVRPEVLEAFQWVELILHAGDMLRRRVAETRTYRPSYRHSKG